MVNAIRDYRADAVLRDGTSIHLRAVRLDDKDRLLHLFSRLSARSVYFRFFRHRQWLSLEELARFTELDFEHDVALAATLREENEERILGIGRYSVIEEGAVAPRRAEVALAVADAFQGRGIGTLLLEHLSTIARSGGIFEFQADVLGENNRMLTLFATAGFTVKRSCESGVFHFALSTEATEEQQEVQFRRERLAVAQSIRSIFEPRSVAVIGASRQPNTIGAALMKNLRGCGFRGPIYPINPRASEIEGLTVYPSLSAVGAPVDLAFILVPGPQVEEAIRACARASARAVVIITAGFGEISGEGRQIEKRLRELVRASGMRMVGPNCMGVINTDPVYSMNGTFVPVWPPSGRIGMLSQSGALGYAILDKMQALHLGVSTFISVGNKADVSGNDLLSYWAEDPHTDVIMLYLESFGNPRKFARLTPELARRKPVVALKSGRSVAGTRAASSHSAALASPDVAVEALFEQAGVIRTDTLEQFLDVVMLLSSQPIPAGPNVGVITNAGGPGILLADACEAHGLVLPEFSQSTLDGLRAFLPFQAGMANPIDMIASATPEQYARAVETVGSDPRIDSLIVIYLPPYLHPPEEVTTALGLAAARVPEEKPVLTVFMSSRGVPAVVAEGPRGRLPTYGFPENAARALAAAERYSRWRRRPRGTFLELDPVAVTAIRAVVDRIMASPGEPSVWLEPDDLASILRAAGVEFAASKVVTLEEAGGAAERMGFPLVVKALSEKLLHKSEAGGVLLGIQTPAGVREAIQTLAARMSRIDIELNQVLLQREVPGGIEALVGVTTDPTFGPLVVCGLGGVLVELLQDVAFRLPPVSDIDAGEMIARMRAQRLLDGYRGQPAGDRQALVDLIQRISALVELVPELQELDLNPVKVLEPGHGAIVVDGRMRIRR